MDRNTWIAHRARRQALDQPVPDEGYVELFRRLQPVAPESASMPGSPPRLIGRTVSDDAEAAQAHRGMGRLVKGRFAGLLSYVWDGDLALFAAAYRKPLTLDPLCHDLLRTLERQGPLSPRQLREETGAMNKAIMPALHRLQEAWLVVELQLDGDWGRPWALFESEWPEVDLRSWTQETAQAEVVMRKLATLVWATEPQLAAATGLGKTAVRRALGSCTNRVEAVSMGGEQGWLQTQDLDLEPLPPARGVRFIHKADPLVQAYLPELKARFPGETLGFLLLDGELDGALMGHWRISEHPVDDLVIDRPDAERFRAEALALVGERWRVLAFNDAPIAPPQGSVE